MVGTNKYSLRMFSAVIFSTAVGGGAIYHMINNWGESDSGDQKDGTQEEEGGVTLEVSATGEEVVDPESEGGESTTSTSDDQDVVLPQTGSITTSPSEAGRSMPIEDTTTQTQKTVISQQPNTPHVHTVPEELKELGSSQETEMPEAMKNIVQKFVEYTQITSQQHLGKKTT